MKKIATNGPTAEHFEKTVNNLKKTIPEARIRNSYWMSALMNNQRYGFDSDKQYEAAVNALTPADVQAAAKAMVDGYLIELVQRPE